VKTTNKSIEWLKRMADFEDEGTVSVGGWVTDIARINAPLEDGRTRSRFGRFLLLAQREKHLTSEEFARKADVDPAELLKIENDPDYAPSPQTVSRIARFLGRPENDLDELARLPASGYDDARQRRAESILHATSGGASRRGG